MFLNEDVFKKIVKNTPLISIDLLIENFQGQILLGKRTNRPARGFWFVPGGRIYKDETLVNAFNRLVFEELCANISYDQAKFIGVFQHFYMDNFSEENFTTHYIVLGYKIIYECDFTILPKKQHNEFKWFSKSEIFYSPVVHSNTKAYF